MIFLKHGFDVLLENEITYFAHLEGVISSVDELASVEVINNPTSYVFRITPSTPAYSQMLLQTLLQFHRLLGIHLDLSKSIKKTSTISFILRKE